MSEPPRDGEGAPSSSATAGEGAAPVRVLERVQRSLEGLYRVEAAPPVGEFVIPEAVRSRLGVERAPREQLLLRQDPAGEALEIALFVDEAALARVARGVGDHNLEEFLLAVEGVSHFLYVSVRAREERRFSALELELQAEVDKFLLVLLAAWPRTGAPPTTALRRRLFRRVEYHCDLTVEERDRYKAANEAADEYAASLSERYLGRRNLLDMLAELRRFYRLDSAGKLDHIAKRAA